MVDTFEKDYVTIRDCFEHNMKTKLGPYDINEFVENLLFTYDGSFRKRVAFVLADEFCPYKLRYTPEMKINIADIDDNKNYAFFEYITALQIWHQNRHLSYDSKPIMAIQVSSKNIAVMLRLSGYGDLI